MLVRYEGILLEGSNATERNNKYLPKTINHIQVHYNNNFTSNYFISIIFDFSKNKNIFTYEATNIKPNYLIAINLQRDYYKTFHDKNMIVAVVKDKLK